MRILHTGDWHLGQSFYNHDREAEHQAFLDWLLEEIGRQEADALLVAGDVFDTGNPPASSMRRFYRFLADAKRRSPSLDIVLIAGNHDSAARFEAPQPILDGLEVKVVGSGRLERSDAVDRMVVPLTGRDGEIGAYCVAIPFVGGSDLPPRATGDEGEGDPYAAGVTALYQRCVARAQELRGDRPIAIVALGHIHLAGGAGSASERALVVGGAEALPTCLLYTSDAAD
ncbi:MAG: exonuclease subunit SbcD, partial [Candidatus Eisenbacteria bacterium]|nr:exonuclease subunit SbcD [Candidatus Eisenbacteria bacterium]